MSQKFDVLQSPEAAELMKDTAKLKALLQSPETRRLMELLTAKNGDGLRRAAEQAKRGDTTALSGMMNQLTQSDEGARLVNQLQEGWK